MTLNLKFFFIRGNLLKEKTWLYQNTQVTDQILKQIHFYKKDLQNRAEMYLIKRISMTHSKQWLVLGKYLLTNLNLFSKQ